MPHFPSDHNHTGFSKLMENNEEVRLYSLLSKRLCKTFSEIVLFHCFNNMWNVSDSRQPNCHKINSLTFPFYSPRDAGIGARLYAQRQQPPKHSLAHPCCQGYASTSLPRSKTTMNGSWLALWMKGRNDATGNDRRRRRERTQPNL